MLLLTSTSDKIQVVTGGTPGIDVHASFADYDTSITNPNDRVSLGRKNTKITTATTTDVVLSPGNATTSRNVKTLEVANIHASTANQVTIQHTDGTNVIQLESINLLAGERIAFREGVPMRVIDASGMEKVNPAVIAGQLQVVRLGADYTNATTTASKVTGLDAVCGAGTWLFEYFLIWRNATAANGAKFSVNHSGTVTAFVCDMYGVTADLVTTGAQTGTISQAVTAATGGVVEGWSQRAKSAAAGLLVGGTDTLSADTMMMISGLMVVTVSGNIELYGASEGGATTMTLLTGSTVRLTKVG